MESSNYANPSTQVETFTLALPLNHILTSNLTSLLTPEPTYTCPAIPRKYYGVSNKPLHVLLVHEVFSVLMSKLFIGKSLSHTLWGDYKTFTLKTT